MTSTPPALSVIIPAHNPHPGRLHRTLAGLRAQTLPADRWETLLVDNASAPALAAADWNAAAPADFRLIAQPEPGLSQARHCGLSAARGEFAVLVDDDNVLAPDYLANLLDLFQANPRVGVLGGRSLPEFESVPPAWAAEFSSLLALRDLGNAPLRSHGLRPTGASRNEYPVFAPIGAGMALRRAAWTVWLDARQAAPNPISDRRGTELTSGGDNDIVLHAMRAGWEVGYFPSLALAHLIPAGRLEPGYLARLNRGIQRSWMQVLTLHDANPWPLLSPAGAAARKAKAWFAYQPWRSPAAHIRWQGACGHFDGRVRS